MNDVVLAILLFVGMIPVMFFVADISERKNEIEAERKEYERQEFFTAYPATARDTKPEDDAED